MPGMTTDATRRMGSTAMPGMATSAEFGKLATLSGKPFECVPAVDDPPSRRRP
jgi:hypothetical protein